MDNFHFSTAECFENCPARFGFRYRQNIEVLPTDDPANPLILGTAIHRGMEKDMETAIQEYKDSYPIITDAHINEIIKLEYWIPKMKELLPEGFHEVNFKNDVYEGTADLIVPCTKHDAGLPHGQFDLYDFKYSNNIDHYMESRQLHVYKYFFQRITGKHIRKMYFVFVPKVQIRQKKTETLAYYWEYLLEEEHEAEDVYGMDYETQYDFFAEYLKWLKAGKHTDNLDKEPQNKTCNAYLKEVFRFYSFLEVVRNNGSCLSVLSYNQPITKANAIGARRTIRSRSFKGYLKEEERNVRAAERNEIVTILEACTNCRDQVLILLTSELGFRIGEIWGIDYTKDIDYENHEILVDFRDDNENDARAKNAEERRGRVSDDTFEFLLYYIGEYWDILQKQEYLFINIKGDTIGKPLRVDSVYDMFERMEKKTGIKITPHMLRRYYANTRWEADWPLEMISQALGHKHLDTTIRYLNVLDDKLKTASQEFYRRYSKLYGVEQFLESRR